MATRKPYRDKGSKRPTARSRELRRNMTPAELRLWSRIRARQVADTRFSSQFPIGPFVCDFVAGTPKLVVDVGGGQHANQAKEDATRTAYIKSKGYRVIRFWNNDVLENTDGVVEVLARILTDSLAPDPSSKREGDA